MKKYIKKFSFIFVMLLSIIGCGAIQNGSVANAATIGEQLLQPEDGWYRIDDADPKISYSTAWEERNWFYDYNSTYHTISRKGEATFYFYGTGIRIIGDMNNYSMGDINIDIDGETTVFQQGGQTKYQCLLFERSSLPVGNHAVKIYTTDNVYHIIIDAIDIKEPIPVSLDQSTIDLAVGDSGQLTATTTPAGAQVTWISSDSSIATVDSNGAITGIKEGQATITATTEDGLNATCTVNVIYKVYLEMPDGNRYSVTDSQVKDFIQWYNNRDNNTSNTPIYKFS